MEVKVEEEEEEMWKEGKLEEAEVDEIQKEETKMWKEGEAEAVLT